MLQAVPSAAPKLVSAEPKESSLGNPDTGGSQARSAVTKASQPADTGGSSEASAPKIIPPLIQKQQPALTSEAAPKAKNIAMAKTASPLKIVPPPLNAAVPFSGLSLPKAASSKSVPKPSEASPGMTSPLSNLVAQAPSAEPKVAALKVVQAAVAGAGPKSALASLAAPSSTAKPTALIQKQQPAPKREAVPKAKSTDKAETAAPLKIVPPSPNVSVPASEVFLLKPAAGRVPTQNAQQW